MREKFLRGWSGLIFHEYTTIFPSYEAIIRLIRALILEIKNEWAVARRYMSLKTVAHVTYNIIARLPVVAAYSFPHLSKGQRSTQHRRILTKQPSLEIVALAKNGAVHSQLPTIVGTRAGGSAKA